jgi:hypothetical protein
MRALEVLPAVGSLDQVMALENAWRGSMRQFFESVARDPRNELPLRLMAAERLLKHEIEKEGGEEARRRAAWLAQTPSERLRRLQLMAGEIGLQLQGRILDAEPSREQCTIASLRRADGLVD